VRVQNTCRPTSPHEVVTTVAVKPGLN